MGATDWNQEYAIVPVHGWEFIKISDAQKGVSIPVTFSHRFQQMPKMYLAFWATNGVSSRETTISCDVLQLTAAGFELNIPPQALEYHVAVHWVAIGMR